MFQLSVAQSNKHRRDLSLDDQRKAPQSANTYQRITSVEIKTHKVKVRYSLTAGQLVE